MPNITTPQILANIAILWSENTRKTNAEKAIQAEATYKFTDAWGNRKTWLQGQHAYLAPSTLSTALNRFNLKHDFIDDAQLESTLAHYDTLFLPSARWLTDAGIAAIEGWLQTEDHFLCVSGPTNLPPALLGLEALEIIQPAGYTAWQWSDESHFGDQTKWETHYVSGYKGYATCQVTPAADSTVLAEQFEVRGDLTSAETATFPSLGPAIVQTPQTLFVANALFEYLGGVFQAHLNNEDVRQWFNVPHWSETLLYQFQETLRQCGLGRLWDVRLRPFGSYDGAMNIRHDPDMSSDYTMLHYQGEHLIPASWVLLDEAFSGDSTTRERDEGWVREVSKYGFIEAGLHNDSADPIIMEGGGSAPKWMMGANLHHHIAESQKNLGITLYTGGRHGGYSVYPEMIDAMDYLYQKMPHFLGLGTFCFHFIVEYGTPTPGFEMGGRPLTYVTNNYPTIAIPGFWFPLHGVVSTIEASYQLRGWDVTHEYDTAPDLVDWVLERYNSKDNDPTTQLPDGVYQFQYHPLFTSDPDYNNGRGTFDWMCYAIRRAERLNLWQASQKMIYKRMQDFEDLEFRVNSEAGTIQVHNPTDRRIAELMVESKQPVGAPESSGPGALGDGGPDDASDDSDLASFSSLRLDTAHATPRYLAHIVQNRYFTLPELTANQSLTVTLEAGEATHPFVAQANNKGLQFINAIFNPETQVLSLEIQVIRKQGLVVQNLRPNTAIQVVVDGVRRQDMTADEKGRLKLFVIGPENEFERQTIKLSPAV